MRKLQVREAFHLEKFVTLLQYDPKVSVAVDKTLLFSLITSFNSFRRPKKTDQLYFRKYAHTIVSLKND